MKNIGLQYVDLSCYKKICDKKIYDTYSVIAGLGHYSDTTLIHEQKKMKSRQIGACI